MNMNITFTPICSEKLDSIIKADEYNKYLLSKPDVYAKRMQNMSVALQDYPCALIYCKICHFYKCDKSKMSSDLIKEFGQVGSWHDKECPLYNYNS